MHVDERPLARMTVPELDFIECAVARIPLTLPQAYPTQTGELRIQAEYREPRSRRQRAREHAQMMPNREPNCNSKNGEPAPRTASFIAIRDERLRTDTRPAERRDSIGVRSWHRCRARSAHDVRIGSHSLVTASTTCGLAQYDAFSNAGFRVLSEYFTFGIGRTA